VEPERNHNALRGLPSSCGQTLAKLLEQHRSPTGHV
jgi:hypothetical protein